MRKDGAEGLGEPSPIGSNPLETIMQFTSRLRGLFYKALDECKTVEDVEKLRWVMLGKNGIIAILFTAIYE